MALNIRKIPMAMGMILVHSLGWGQANMHDPTMPPPGAGVPMPQVAGPADPGVPSAVQIRKLGPARKGVPIGDRTFQAGEQLGAWRVVRITADGMVLQTGAGSRSIPVQPVVKKKVIPGTAPASSMKNGKP